MKLFVKISGLVTFSILFVLALIFYKERATTFDMARQGFYILLTKNVLITNQRIGAAIPQLLPLALRWLNCPLRTILMASSLGLVAFYLLFFLVLTFIMRHYVAALVFLLSMVLLVNDTFYWIQSELPQGLAWLILYYAYLERKGVEDIRRRPLLHFALLLFIQFLHPLLFFPLLYLLLYLLYQQYKFNRPFYKWPLAIIVTNFCIRLGVSKFNSYEGSKLDIVAKLQHHQIRLLQLLDPHKLLSWHIGLYIIVLIAGLFVVVIAMRKHLYRLVFAMLFAAFAFGIYGLIRWLRVPSISMVIHFAGTDYLVYWLIFLLTIHTLARKRDFYLLALLSLFTGCYLLLICLTNRHADKFYLENLMLPLGIFLLFPFVQLLMSADYNFRKPALGFLAIIICVRLVFIYDTHSMYTNRLLWYEGKFKEMDRNHSQKLLLTEKNVPMDTLVMSWPSGYESVMLSSIDGPQYTKSIVIDTTLSDYNPYSRTDTVLLAKWLVIDERELPKNYFIMHPGNYEAH